MKKLGNATKGVGSQLKSVASGIDKVGLVSKSLDTVDFSSLTSGVQRLATALQPLSGFKTQATGLIGSLQSVKGAFNELGSINTKEFEAFGNQIATLTDKMKPLNVVAGKLGATLKALNSVGDVANTLQSLNEAVSGGGETSSETRFDKFAQDIERLSQALLPLNGIKSSIGSLINTLTRFTQVGNALESVDFGKFSRSIQQLTSALKPLTLFSSKVNTTFNALAKLPLIAKELNTVNFTRFSENIQVLMRSLEPLKKVDTAGFNKTVGALNRVGVASEKVADMDFNKLKMSVKSLASSMKPLQTQTNGCSKSFSIFGPRLNSASAGMRGLHKATTKTSSAFDGLRKSLSGSVIKFGILYAGAHRVASKLGEFVTESNAYVENLNLFTVSMGDAADSAKAFAEMVSGKLGLDPSAFMRYQGILQQITTGFGVASSKASVMSKNLTQIGYDISSFFNLGITESMEKLQSGIAGELEPLRRIGYALDEATLQQVAYNHGVDISIRKMTQAQKSQIRYIAIMEQSGNVMGDMARTLITPANSMRILSQQVTLLARAIGNMLIPMLTRLLPYLIAVIQYATVAANRLASLWGFKIPEIDYGDGLSAGTEATEDLSNGFNDVADATDEATKALQKYLAPFDEINKPSSSSETSKPTSDKDNSFGNDLNIKLPEYDFLKGFKEQAKVAFGDAFDVLKQAWDEKGQALMDAVKGSMNEIKALCKSIGRSFSEIWNDGTGLELVNTFLKLLTNMSLIVGDIAIAFRKAWDEAGRGTALVKTLFSMATELLRVVNNIAESFRQVWNNGSGQEIFKQLILLATNFFEIVKSIARAFNEAWTSSSLGTSLLQSIASLCEHILYFANNIAQVFLSVWTNGTGVTLFTQILTIIKTIVDTADLIAMKFNAAWLESDRGKQIIQTLADAFSNVLTFIQLVCDSAKEFWSVMGSSFAESVMNGIQALADGLEHLTQKFVEVWDNGGNQFFQSLGQLIGKVLELAGVVGGELMIVMSDGLAPVLGTMLGILAKVFDVISQIIDWLLADGRPVLDGLVYVLAEVFTAWAAWKGITAIINPIIGVVTKMAGLFPVFGKLKGFISGLGTSFSGLGSFISKIGGLIKGLPGKFVTAFGAIKTAFSTLTAFLVANPIVAVILAIVATLIILWNTNEDFRNAVIAIWEAISGSIQDIWGGICALFSGDTEGFVEHATNLFNRLPGPIKDALSTTGTVASETWGGFCAMLAGDTEGMRTHVQNIFDALPEPVRNAIMGLGTWLLEKWNEISTNISNFGQTVSEGWNWIWTNISMFCQNIWATITTIWNNIWTTLSTICQNIWNGIVTAWNNIWTTISTVCQNIWNWITTTWNNIWTTISTVCQNIWNWVVTTWNNIWTTISTICQNIWNWIVTVWNNIWTTISTVCQNIWNWISNVWNNICATIVSICQNIWNWISNIWNNICTTVTSICQNIWNWLSNIWNNILNTITSICENIKNWVSEKWEALKNAISNAVEGAKNAVSNAFTGIYDFVTSKVRTLVDNVTKWWDELREKLSKPITAVVNTIKNTLFGKDGNTEEPNKKTSASSFGKLKGYATGGFPTSGQMFIARENGLPEMVGSIGGKTAVANNGQIEDAIAVAVYKAMMSAMQSAGGNSSGSNQPTQITVNLGEETLINKVIKGINAESRRQGQILINV